MQYDISLIIPVYNTEKFIEKCLESVCRQTLDIFEIIIIDDCSPDNALNIVKKTLEKFPKRNFHAKIISFNTNCGIAAVRKHAFSAARGNYIASLDSDDYLELDALEKMLNNAKENESDIVFSDYYINTKKNQKIVQQQPSYDTDETIKKFLEDKLHGSLCNKLFKKDLLHKVCILDRVNMSEDLLICIQAVFYCSKISYLPIPLLHYVKLNSNSYTTVFSQNKIDQMVKGVEFLDHFFKKNNVQYKFRDSLSFRKIIIKSDALTYNEGKISEKNIKLFEKCLQNIIYDKRVNFYKNLLLILIKLRCIFLIYLVVKIRNKAKKIKGIFQ